MTRFQIEPGDTSVRYGEGVNIIVTTMGPAVDDLELVLLADSISGKDDKLPMFPESTGRWGATISVVTAPIHYFVR